MAVRDTAALPARDQFGHRHDAICQAFVPLTPHRVHDRDGFPAAVETRPLGS